VYEPGSFLWVVNNIFFQYYSLLITLVCIAVMLAVSYATEAPSATQIAGLTFGSTSDEDKALSRASWMRLDVILSVVVVLLIVAIYLVFTG
jgi:SSS family solute:Na+ symporter